MLLVETNTGMQILDFANAAHNPDAEEVQLPKETLNPAAIMIPILVIVIGVAVFIVTKKFKKYN